MSQNSAVTHVGPKPVAVEEVDANGDYIFRFRLAAVANRPSLPLADSYRQSIYNLLQLVRFYHKGQPVIVDEFAFLNDPATRIPILPPPGEQRD